jgi:hypothetical protein
MSTPLMTLQTSIEFIALQTVLDKQCDPGVVDYIKLNEHGICTVVYPVAGRIAVNGELDLTQELHMSKHAYEVGAELNITATQTTEDGNIYGRFERDGDTVWILMKGKASGMTYKIRVCHGTKMVDKTINISHDGQVTVISSVPVNVE